MCIEKRVEIIKVQSGRIIFRSDLNYEVVKKKRNRVLKAICVKDTNDKFWEIYPRSEEGTYEAILCVRKKCKKSNLEILGDISLAISIIALLFSILSLALRVIALI